MPVSTGQTGVGSVEKIISQANFSHMLFKVKCLWFQQEPRCQLKFSNTIKEKKFPLKFLPWNWTYYVKFFELFKKRPNSRNCMSKVCPNARADYSESKKSNKIIPISYKFLYNGKEKPLKWTLQQYHMEGDKNTTWKYWKRNN